MSLTSEPPVAPPLVSVRSLRARAMWANPKYRANQLAHRAKLRALRKINPGARAEARKPVLSQCFACGLEICVGLSEPQASKIICSECRAARVERVLSARAKAQAALGAHNE